MPHRRPRSLLPILKKRMNLWPVLGVLGPRQVGKSTLLRDLLSPDIKANYLTMDRQEVRLRAERATGHFLRASSEEQRKILILDEVQKVPELFNAIKAEVDENRRPGRFIVSGSTEFSARTGIRESLTGRIGILRMYPMTVAEMHESVTAHAWVNGPRRSSIGAHHIERYLERGGMPGIAFLRDEDERQAAFEAWLDTACNRDIQLVKGAKLSGSLARDVLATLCQVEHPSIAAVAKTLKVDARRVRNHVTALESLFILTAIDPHPAGVGKTEYLVCDAGLAHHLGARGITCLRIWAVNECLAQHEFEGAARPRLRYYQSAKGSRLDLVVESNRRSRPHSQAVLLSLEADPGPYVERTVEAFFEKTKMSDIKILAPTAELISESKHCQIVPWTWMT